MCGRYVRRGDKQRIAEAFHVGEMPDFAMPDADYNVAPTTFQPVIRESRDTGERELILARWGLVPFFAKELSDVKGTSTINARAETIATSRTWREPFKKRRCLVPASAFYEWDKKSGGKTKQPYAFDLANGQMFAFAGVWNAWKDKDGHWLQSFSIVTTGANELMARIHDRMPVILRPRDYDRWLDREVTEQPPVDLLRPFDTEEMEMRPANPAVGNYRNNGAEMLVCPADVSNTGEPGLWE
jgi:putative SOS response-associated peptidase YedK